MRDLPRKLVEKLPLEFRVLYRQFLLRVVDLEALSVHADVPRFLGQFAGVLILINVFRTIGFLFFEVGNPSVDPASLITVIWQREQWLVSTMMLVTGLIAVVSWDAIFPDRRDAMVLGPLPVRPGTILAAKVAACAAVLGIALVSLGSGMGIVLPLVAGSARLFAGYWFSMAAACVFVYGAVLAVQGLMALMLPRKMFLRLSAALQLAAFAWFVASYFLEPTLWNPGFVRVVAARGDLNVWPSYWFFAMEQQIAGAMPAEMRGIAMRAWIGLAVVVVGAGLSLVLCYLRTMKKTVEQPDLVPGRSSWRWTPRLRGSVETAVVRFTARGITRSRHHRVIYAFYWAIVFAITVTTLKAEAAGRWRLPVTQSYRMPTLTMMCLAVVGLRSVFALPVALNANWVLQVTQLNPSQLYIAGTRRALLLLSGAPVWGCGVAGIGVPAAGPRRGALAGAGADGVDSGGAVPDRSGEDSVRLLVSAGEDKYPVCVLGVCPDLFPGGDVAGKRGDAGAGGPGSVRGDGRDLGSDRGGTLGGEPAAGSLGGVALRGTGAGGDHDAGNRVVGG